MIQCQPLSQQEIDTLNEDAIVNKTLPYKQIELLIKTEGFLYKNMIRFGEEPLFYNVPSSGDQKVPLNISSSSSGSKIDDL